MVLKKKKNTKCFSNGIEELKKRVAENYATHLKQKTRADKVTELTDTVPTQVLVY